MLGKEKCKILKEIRKRIADENDIPYVTRECTHQGECRGTCPRCEAELRELERQLLARQQAGKRVAVAALCASLALSSVGCTRSGGRVTVTPDDLSGAVAPEPSPEPTPELFVTEGEVAWPEETEEPTELMGDVAWPEETEPPEILAGEALPSETNTEDGHA